MLKHSLERGSDWSGRLMGSGLHQSKGCMATHTDEGRRLTT